MASSNLYNNHVLQKRHQRMRVAPRIFSSGIKGIGGGNSSALRWFPSPKTAINNDMPKWVDGIGLEISEGASDMSTSPR